MNILEKAQKKGYAIAHLNIMNMEVVKAVAEAAQETKSPVIMATSESAIKYCGYSFLANMAKAAIEQYNISAILHADHIHDVETVKKCIAYGWDSVMIDASGYSFEKNVAMTQKVVKLAKRRVWVEAEIGQLKEHEATSPYDAEKFVQLTKVDSLAIALGTSHGAFKYKGKPRLDFEALKEIRKRLDIPLVLHGASAVYPEVVTKLRKYGVKLDGASGVPDATIKKAISMGISKINVGTDTKLSFLLGVREYLQKNKNDIVLNDYLGYASDKVKEMAKHKMILFGSAGKDV